MQYTEGTARILSATPTRVVLGNGATTVDNIKLGDFWRFQGDVPGFYFVGAIVDEVTFDITAPYVGGMTFDEDHDYLVVRDFSTNRRLAFLEPGDVDIRQVFTFDMQLIDTILGVSSSGGGGGGGGGTTGGAFESGTRMLFDQDTAPLGWTRDTSAGLDDRVVRIVGPGARADGGSWTITGITIGPHKHPLPFGATGNGGGNLIGRVALEPPFGVSDATYHWDFGISEAPSDFTSVAALSGEGTGALASDGSWRPLNRACIVASKD
jgi:hypothetical protein